MKRTAILSLVLSLIAAQAWAQTNNQNGATDPDALRHCQSYLECTLVWSGCEDVAINKKYVSQFKPSSACMQSTDHDPKAIPTCLEGLCVMSTSEETK